MKRGAEGLSAATSVSLALLCLSAFQTRCNETDCREAQERPFFHLVEGHRERIVSNAFAKGPKRPLATETQLRLCVFVIAYHAEATLKQVLDRIPRSVFATFDCEVLVVDDASVDRTLEI